MPRAAASPRPHPVPLLPAVEASLAVAEGAFADAQRIMLSYKSAGAAPEDAAAAQPESETSLDEEEPLDLDGMLGDGAAAMLGAPVAGPKPEPEPEPQPPALARVAGTVASLPVVRVSTPPAARHAPRPTTMAVVCLEDVAPGQLIQVEVPSGQLIEVGVLDGVAPGGEFEIEITPAGDAPEAPPAWADEGELAAALAEAQEVQMDQHRLEFEEEFAVEEGEPPESPAARSPGGTRKKKKKKKKKKPKHGALSPRTQLHPDALARVEKRQWRAEVTGLMREDEARQAREAAASPPLEEQWNSDDEFDEEYERNLTLAERAATNQRKHGHRLPVDATRWVGQGWNSTQARQPVVGTGAISLLGESEMIVTQDVESSFEQTSLPLSPRARDREGRRGSGRGREGGRGRKEGGKGKKAKRKAAEAAAAERVRAAAETAALMVHAAQWVAVHGAVFEELLRQRHAQTAGWEFLAPGGEGHADYRLRLDEELSKAEATKPGAVQPVEAAVMRRQGDPRLAAAADDRTQASASTSGAGPGEEVGADTAAEGGDASKPEEATETGGANSTQPVSVHVDANGCGVGFDDWAKVGLGDVSAIPVGARPEQMQAEGNRTNVLPGFDWDNSSAFAGWTVDIKSDSGSAGAGSGTGGMLPTAAAGLL